MSEERPAGVRLRHRRWTGLVVVGVALVLVAVLTGARPHVVAGAGRAAPIPGPPAVGDCVVDPLPTPSLVVPTVTAHSGGTVPVYPAQQIHPCSGPRYGEIVSVIGRPDPTVVKGDAVNGFELDDPNQDSCFFAAYAYLGMTAKPMFGFWQTYLQFSTALSRPSLRQQSVGQRWAVCIVTVPPPDPGSAPTTATPTSPPYDSSIRDALRTGVEGDQMGTCLTTLDWSAGFRSGSCRQPHPLELLGSGDSGDRPVRREQVEATCRQLVRQLTAMADPSAAGALSIRIDVTGMNAAAITTAQIPPHSILECGVATTGARRLRGSLLALGSRPIPWTP